MGSTRREGEILYQFTSCQDASVRPGPKLHYKVVPKQIQHSPSPGIEQTEASTDEAVSVLTHASAVVTRALTTAAGPETHHQHQHQEGSLRGSMRAWEEGRVAQERLLQDRSEDQEAETRGESSEIRTDRTRG